MSTTPATGGTTGIRRGPPRTGWGDHGPRWSEEGLSRPEVDVRVAGGAVNRAPDRMSQSWAQILRRNAFTRLNLLLVALGGATLATGSAPDATFLAIAVINTVIGAVQEARAKRQLDALAVVNAPQLGK